MLLKWNVVSLLHEFSSLPDDNYENNKDLVDTRSIHSYVASTYMSNITDVF